MKRRIITTLDSYLLGNLIGTLGSVVAIVISLMLFEQLARSIEFVRFSGEKGRVIAEGMLALLPEYAGLGLLFGLYLAIALTVRRLAMRNELAVMEATGIAPLRWMRVPVLLGVTVAALLLVLQGWVIPAGEAHLTELNLQVLAGRFGYDFQSAEFIDVGDGILRFDRVKGSTGELGGVFFDTGNKVLSAPAGSLAMAVDGAVRLQLDDGSAINEAGHKVLSFSRFQFLSNRGAQVGADTGDELQQRKETALPHLMASSAPEDQASAWSRLMWPALALTIPFLALALGKPGRPTGSFLGLAVGIGLLLVWMRSIEWVQSTSVRHPSLLAITLMSVWSGIAALLICGERRWGPGYVDAWLRQFVSRCRRRLPRFFRVRPRQPPRLHVFEQPKSSTARSSTSLNQRNAVGGVAPVAASCSRAQRHSKTEPAVRQNGR